MGPGPVEPEDGGEAGGAGALDGEFDPVADGGVFGLAGAPDIAGFDLVLGEGAAVRIDDAHGAGSGDLKGLIVGTVFLGGLRHEADVGNGAHCFRIEGAVLLTELDGGRGRGGEGDGLFVGAEVVRAHGDDAGFGVLAPRAHFVRMFAGVIFNGFGRTAVGVAFAQDGVNRAAFNFVIARLSVPLTGIARCLGIVGKREALFLQFSYGGFELREGRADVGEFDDVGPGLQGECAEFGQGVGGLLAGGEAVGEGGEEASGEGDIAEFDGDASGAGEGLDDRKERVGGEERGFVCLGVDDGRLGRHELCFISRSASGQNLVVVACDVSEKESAARAPLTTAGYDRAPRDRERRLKLHPVYCGAAGSRRRR